MAKFRFNPITGGLDRVEDISEIENVSSTAIQPTDNISNLTNDVNYQTETQVDVKIADLVNAAPTTLDTLNELAAALNDDPNFAATVSAELGQKVTKVVAVDNSVIRADGTSGDIQGSDVYISNAGRLGIGTETPERELHIDNGIIRLDRTSNSTTVMLVRKDTSGNVLKSFRFGMQASATNDGSFDISDAGTAVSGGSSVRFRIENDGTIFINNRRIVNVADPVDPQDVVNLRTLENLLLTGVSSNNISYDDSGNESALGTNVQLALDVLETREAFNRQDTDTNTTNISTLNTEQTTQDTAIALNTAKVSFPEAPIDGSQYIRKDGDWEVATSPGAPVDSVNGKIGTVILNSTDVGLGNVDNTSDSNKPVSTAQQAEIDTKAESVHTHLKADITDLNEADYATAAQGVLAGTAIQPGDLATVATSGDYNDLINQPAAPGAAPVDSVNSKIGVVVLEAADIAYDDTNNTNAIGSDIQAALDELENRSESLSSDIVTVQGEQSIQATNISNNQSDITLLQTQITLKADKTARKVFKNLTSDQTVTTTSIAQLAVTGLVIGKSYRANLQGLLQGTGFGVALFIRHDGVQLTRMGDLPPSGQSLFTNGSSVVEFVATTTTIEIEAIVPAGSSIGAGTGRTGTHFEVTELPYDINVVSNF